MTLIKADFSNRILAALCAVFAAFTVACFIGCGGIGIGGTTEKLVSVSGIVRTFDFKPLETDILYDGKKVGASDSSGAFTVKVPLGDDIVHTAKLTVDGNAFTYADYTYNNGHRLVIVLGNDGMTVDDFCYIGGKVVLHSDGETVAPGCELRIDGVTVLNIENDRNFDIKFVYKDSVVSAYKQGGTFVDNNEIPHDHMSPSDMLDKCKDTTELTVNGKKCILKQLGGVTFRLNDITGSSFGR